MLFVLLLAYLLVLFGQGIPLPGDNTELAVLLSAAGAWGLTSLVIWATDQRKHPLQPRFKMFLSWGALLLVTALFYFLLVTFEGTAADSAGYYSMLPLTYAGQKLLYEITAKGVANGGSDQTTPAPL